VLNFFIDDVYSAKPRTYDLLPTSILEGTDSIVFDGVSGITFDYLNNIYIFDNANQVIKYGFVKFLTYKGKWGQLGSGNGAFNVKAQNGNFLTVDLAVSNDGKFIYVTDPGNNRIQKFNNLGEFQKSFGKEGSGKDEFSLPSGIAVDINNFIYVTDMNNHRIKKINDNGDVIDIWGFKGKGWGFLNSPVGITTDNKGFVYVADSLNKRIVKYDNEGNVFDEIYVVGNPLDVAIDRGFLYVLTKDAVVRYNATDKLPEEVVINDLGFGAKLAINCKSHVMLVSDFVYDNILVIHPTNYNAKSDADHCIEGIGSMNVGQTINPNQGSFDDREIIIIKPKPK
jgi:DNA-binding beta-propeller fold protein YncE